MKIFFLAGAIFFTSTIFSCPFCDPQIIADQKVFESDTLYVLADYMPRVKGHLLIIPKRHVVRAEEMKDQEWKELGLTIQAVVKVFKESLGTDQYIILEKNGPKAFQEIPHVHFHLLPVVNETWKEIFFIAPRKLDPEELQQEVLFFIKYFSGNLPEYAAMP